MSTIDKLSFKVISWEEWSETVIKRITEEIKIGNIDIGDLIYAPKLDPDDPKPFCKRFSFDDVYDDRVFVRDHKDKDCYWFINGDSTCLIYKPKLA